MKVVPLSVTQINWMQFITTATEVVGRSPMRSIDAANVKPGDPFSFIAALRELDTPGISPRDAVRIPSVYLEHVSVGFLVHVSASEEWHIGSLPLIRRVDIDGKDIPRQEPDKLILLSGTLFEWRTVVSVILTRTDDYIQRELFNKIYLWFKQFNLRELFDEFTEVDVPGGGFRLERKR